MLRKHLFNVLSIVFLLPHLSQRNDLVISCLPSRAWLDEENRIRFKRGRYDAVVIGVIQEHGLVLRLQITTTNAAYEGKSNTTIPPCTFSLAVRQLRTPRNLFVLK